jgi:hypothetical protein
VDENDLVRVRRAVAAYFRTAAALGSASLAARQAAMTVADDLPGEENSDREFLLDRVETYHQKALLMSRSAAALLSHSERWFSEELEEPSSEVDEVLGSFALEVEAAADGYGDVLEALEGTSFASHREYQELLAELRMSGRFLMTEAAVFGRDEVDDESEEVLKEGAASEHETSTAFQAGAQAPQPIDFDRRVPDVLVRALAPGGVFDWVSTLAAAPVGQTGRPLDLGLRASPKYLGAGQATLYVGTTQVLGVHVRADGRFRLTGHQRDGLFGQVDPPFAAAWENWQSLADLATVAPHLEHHVEAAIDAAPEGRQQEGCFQAALGKRQAEGYALVDREIVLSFSSREAKRGWFDEHRQPLVEVQKSLGQSHDWAAARGRPGDKLDALAIGREGRLLAIEVKPGGASRDLVWTPVQVAMYVRLLRAWIEPDQERAREVIEGMAAQRSDLGLGPTEPPRLRMPIELVPVIAVGGPVTGRAVVQPRFDEVRAALGAANEPLDGLQLWKIDHDGEVSITDATELDERFE